MGPRAAITTVDGLEVRTAPVPPGDVFQVREAVTVRQGPRGGRKRVRSTGGTPVPLDAGATEGNEAEASGATFQVREAVTTTLPPPHWAKLAQAEPEAEAIQVAQASPPVTDADSQPEPAPAAPVGQASPPAGLEED